MPENGESILELLRKHYEKPSMSEEAVSEMKRRIEKAKKEKRAMAKRRRMRGWTIAAALTLAVLILPNTSSSVAQAMANIPVLGGFFKVITFRNYQYKDERNVADVVVPEIRVEEKSDDSVSEKGKKTADEINAEIREITDRWVEEFKANMEGEGYQNLMIDSQVIAVTDDYFTLKLIVSGPAAAAMAPPMAAAM